MKSIFDAFTIEMSQKANPQVLPDNLPVCPECGRTVKPVWAHHTKQFIALHGWGCKEPAVGATVGECIEDWRNQRRNFIA